MPLTQFDVSLLQTLAKYYVLTREQLQRLCFPDHSGGRTTRKRLTKLQHGDFVRKHPVPVALPGSNGAAPVYYVTKPGAELLASWFDDQSYLAVNTRCPRGDRLTHWIAVNETRMLIEAAVARQSLVTLEGFVNEWETVEKSAAEQDRFTLRTQFSQEPPLSCSPDAAFLLAAGPHKKVFYLERDLGTSSPRQIAARKTKGYAALAAEQGHRRHFPLTTLDAFRVLFVTVNRYRCLEAAKQVGKRPGADLWLFIDEHDLSPETFLHSPVTWNAALEVGPLVKLPGGASPPPVSGNGSPKPQQPIAASTSHASGDLPAARSGSSEGR